MRILLVDESAGRSARLREALENAGHEVIATLDSPIVLDRAVAALAPDAIVIDVESPSRDTLEHIVLASRDAPRPVVLFTADHAQASIREAMRAGVAAYVAQDLAPERVQSVLAVACAQFAEFQRLRDALASANRRLAERKLVERAKGVLMRTRGLSEEDAYAFLRKVAMSRKERMVVVAERVIENG